MQALLNAQATESKAKSQEFIKNVSPLSLRRTLIDRYIIIVLINYYTVFLLSGSCRLDGCFDVIYSGVLI